MHLLVRVGDTQNPHVTVRFTGQVAVLFPGRTTVGTSLVSRRQEWQVVE